MVLWLTFVGLMHVGQPGKPTACGNSRTLVTARWTTVTRLSSLSRWFTQPFASMKIIMALTTGVLDLLGMLVSLSAPTQADPSQRSGHPGGAPSRTTAKRRIRRCSFPPSEDLRRVQVAAVDTTV